MNISVDPPDRVGPIALGMSVEQADDALRRIDGLQAEDGPREPLHGQANYASGLSIHTHFGPGSLVNAIEVFRPRADVSVLLHGFDIFGLPAQEVVERIGEFAELEEEERGCSFIAPELLVALWRPFVSTTEEDEQGYYFQSVLVARPGYYD
ncbi:hypothetical protein ABII15_26710 [Streptomyces sp. HUAS MG91]|uniref:Uncharacterized protein n=1 Tax=Streptomyces tabacisoli TaxID=3156398 RepID=A0AAU8IYM0_9ACTN